MSDDGGYERENRARLGKYPAVDAYYVNLLSGHDVPADWPNYDFPTASYGPHNGSPEGLRIDGSSERMNQDHEVNDSPGGVRKDSQYVSSYETWHAG